MNPKWTRGQMRLPPFASAEVVAKNRSGFRGYENGTRAHSTRTSCY